MIARHVAIGVLVALVLVGSDVAEARSRHHHPGHYAHGLRCRLGMFFRPSLGRCSYTLGRYAPHHVRHRIKRHVRVARVVRPSDPPSWAGRIDFAAVPKPAVAGASR